MILSAGYIMYGPCTTPPLQTVALFRYTKFFLHDIEFDMRTLLLLSCTPEQHNIQLLWPFSNCMKTMPENETT